MKYITKLSVLGLSGFMLLAACSKSGTKDKDKGSNVGTTPVDSADVVVANPEDKAETPVAEQVLDGDLSTNPTVPPVTELPVVEEEKDDGDYETPIVENPPVEEEPVVTPPVDETPVVPKGFFIRSIATEGEGCSGNSTATNISEDKKAFTVTFSEFNTSLEAGMKKSEIACRLKLTMDVPVGWQYSVASFNYRGFLELEEGVESLLSTRYFFTGKGKAGGFRHKEVGAISKDFVYTDKVDILTALLSREWSACSGNRDLNIDTAIRLRNTDVVKVPTATGLFSNDSIDGEIKQEFGLTWRRCS